MANATKEVRLRETDPVEYESVLYSLRRRMTITCDCLRPPHVLPISRAPRCATAPADVSPRPTGRFYANLLILHEVGRACNPWSAQQMYYAPANTIDDEAQIP